MVHETIFSRSNGSQVRILAQLYTGAGLQESVGTDVFHRERSDDNWRLCDDRPA